MPDVSPHRFSIDPPGERVHDLIATAGRLARWSTGRPLRGRAESGGRFRGAGKPAAVMKGRGRHPQRDHLTRSGRPDSWIGLMLSAPASRTADLIHAAPGNESWCGCGSPRRPGHSLQPVPAPLPKPGWRKPFLALMSPVCGG